MVFKQRLSGIRNNMGISQSQPAYYLNEKHLSLI